MRGAGGAFGKKEKAAEDQYFRQQQQKQLPTHLKKSHGHGDGYGEWPMFHIGLSLFMIVLIIKDYNWKPINSELDMFLFFSEYTQFVL